MHPERKPLGEALGEDFLGRREASRVPLIMPAHGASRILSCIGDTFRGRENCEFVMIYVDIRHRSPMANQARLVNGLGYPFASFIRIRHFH